MSKSLSSPAEFLNEVSDAVEGHLSDGIQILKQDLIKVIHTKKLLEVPEGRLDDTCMQIFEKSKEAFEKNMEKFKIYAMRNVFVPAAPSSSHSATAGHSTPPPNTTDEQLLQLRAQYLSLQSELRELGDSCRDTELLVKDMRSTLFTLRVGAQAFDDGDILPVAETVANITQNREKLMRMVAEANGILNSLDENKKTNEGSNESSDAMDVANDPADPPVVIETNGLDDVLLLGKSLRK